MKPIDKDNTQLKDSAYIQGSSQLWPSRNYSQQVEQLKNVIGKTIYIVELCVTEINVGVHHTGHGYELLDVLDYPQPDPKTNLYPHYILLNDGRGINLGRIEQISTEQAFNPPQSKIIYHDQQLLNKLLPHQERFSNESVILTSRFALEELLGKQHAQRLVNDQQANEKTNDFISKTTGE